MGFVVAIGLLAAIGYAVTRSAEMARIVTRAWIALSIAWVGLLLIGVDRPFDHQMALLVFLPPVIGYVLLWSVAWIMRPF